VEDPGRGEVLGAVLAPLAFGLVEEVAVPVRAMEILAVGDGDDGRKARVGIPLDAAAPFVRLEVECGVGVVQRVVVAAGEQGPDDELGVRAWIEQCPGAEHGGLAVAHESLVAHADAGREGIDPDRPGVVCPRGDVGGAERVNDAGGVAV
jgi:hypothetical protein